MSFSDPERHLACHPRTPAPMIRLLTAEIRRLSAGGLVLSYHLSGDMARLLIPANRSAERRDGLWEHTCFEAFIALAGEPAYREFNFSPSGQWAAYAFSAYRQPEKSPLLIEPPQISASLSAGRLILTARLEASSLPSRAGTAILQAGLSAVVESTDTQDGNRSYWALHHPLPHPDFHHRDGFTLELPVPQENT